MSRQALGRGLDALIRQVPVRSETTTSAEEIVAVPLAAIRPNPRQPRRQFDEAKLEELAQSIRKRGVLEPLLVRSLEDGTYELVAGERRLRAAEQAGLTEVPALLRDFAGESSLEVALIENLQREDLNPVDEARAYQQLVEEFGRTHAEISQHVGKDRSTITNLMRLLRLPEEVLDLVSRGTLSVGHARVLLALEDSGDQARLARRIVGEGWNVRQAERFVSESPGRQSRSSNRASKPAKARDREVVRVEEALRYRLGTEVHLAHGPSGGRIEIRYSSREELERILDLLEIEVR